VRVREESKVEEVEEKVQENKEVIVKNRYDIEESAKENSI